MKSKLMKRTIALLLCMVMVLSNGAYALADGTTTEEAAVEAVTEDTAPVEEPAPAPVVEETVETPAATTEEVVTEEPTTETTTESTETTTAETTTEAVEETVETEEKTEGVQVEAAEEKAEETKTETELTVASELATAINEVLQILDYEDDDVKIHVEEVVDGAIPEGASLKVTPITAESDEEEYNEVETKLNEKAENEEYEIAGFLAYDITFIDATGNEIEPNGNVKVTMEYKNAIIPETVDTEANLDVTVMHFEENEAGEVEEIVDMVATKEIEAEVKTTENAEVEKAEFATNSFSVFTITWTKTYGGSTQLRATVHYGYYNGTEYVEFENVSRAPADVTITDTTAHDLHDSEYVISIEGYKFKEVRLDSWTGTTARYLKRAMMSNKLQYSNDGDSYSDWANLSSGTTEKNIYYIYEIASTGGGSSSGGNTSQVVAELAHQKYIKDNQDGSYDLTLNVIGSAGTETEPAKIDVIFVVDTSGSMAYGMNTSTNASTGNRRIDKLNPAVTQAIQAIEAKTDVEAKYALVTFASSATTKQNWTTSANSITSKLPTSVDGGTNYEDALIEVENLLKSSTVLNDGATKIVVFLTDGDCTLYNYGGTTAGNGKNYDSTAMSRAQTVLQRLTSMSAFYTVGVGPSSSYTHLSELNTKVPSGVATKSYNGTNVGNLADAFSEIVGSVTKISASNLTIVDTLTEHVDIKEGTSLTVKVTDVSGNDVTATEVAAGGIAASYDAATKQIRLDFNDNYEVKDDYTYSVTAVIEPNEAANQLYIENNYTYPHEGEANTDAVGNTTSSGKKGIFSNVDDSAKLTYTTAGTNKESEYNRPVVQIKTAPTAPPTTEQELTREKYIKYYADSDSYDLTLNVAGQVGSVNNQAKVDVILVIDTSGSMKGSNLTATKDAVKTLVTALNNKSETIDARCKITTFASGSSVKTSGWVTPTEAYENIIYKWADGNMEGGTNYQRGLESATSVLQTKRDGSQTVVIFLTDGKPTFYGDEIGTGSDTSVNILNAAYTAAEGIRCDQFYAVGINLPGEGGIKVFEKDDESEYYRDEESYTTSGIKILRDIRDKVTATTKEAYNSTDNNLPNIFSTIAGSITKFFCTNVTIKDNLSEFVEVNGQNAKLEIKVTKTVTAEDGTTSEEVVGTSSGGTVSGGATLSLAKTETNEAATLTASYDPALKQVKLDFPDNYELEADYKYYVTVNIIASAKAYQDYAANGGAYNKDSEGNVIAGDKGTDAEGNATSVDKPGFRSNTTATVTYTYNGTESSASYDHPVVQVFVKEHSVEKVWVGSALPEIIAKIDAKVTIDGVEKTITNAEFSALPSTGQNLSDANEWKYTWLYLPKYYHENGKVSEITYTVSEEMTNTIEEDYTVTYDNATSGKTIITNTFNKEWQILKVSSNSDKLKLNGAKFRLVSTPDAVHRFTATSNFNGVSDGVLEWKDASGNPITIKDIPAGTYELTETEAPSGYAISANTWVVTFERAGAIPTISVGGKTIEPDVSEDGKMYTFSFKNEALYSLPSSGGFGIYWYMVAGVVMMMAAAAILYKNRRKEVLERINRR